MTFFSTTHRPRQQTVALALVIIAVAGSLTACGGRGRGSGTLPQAKITVIGVNSYLWRASLETVGFLPLTQTDAASGVILSDWYINPKIPDERIKLSVFVLDSDLRADAIRVNVQRQAKVDGQWVDAPVQAGTVQKLEDTILVRARALRQASARP